jgi:hypothetical protein
VLGRPHEDGVLRNVPPRTVQGQKANDPLRLPERLVARQRKLSETSVNARGQH